MVYRSDYLDLDCSMGILDRAFGVDKNSTLYTRLAFHWRMVASHYENYPLKNVIPEDQAKLMKSLSEKSNNLGGILLDSKKGFGVISVDSTIVSRELESLTTLYSQTTIITDKHHWLPQAVFITKDVVAGNKRNYVNNQYWFTD